MILKLNIYVLSQPHSIKLIKDLKKKKVEIKMNQNIEKILLEKILN